MKKSLKALVATTATLIGCFAMSTLVFATPVSGLKQTDASTGSVDVSWNPNLSAYGYQTQISTSSSFTGNVRTENAYSPDDMFFDLAAGQTYYVRVRSYNMGDGGSYIYDEWSNALQVVTLPETTGSEKITLTNSTTNSITIKWPVVAGATGYVIRDSDNRYLTRTSGNSVTLKNMKSDLYAYIKVIPVKKSSAGFEKESSHYMVLYSSSIKLIPKKATGLTAKNITEDSVWLEYDQPDMADGAQFQIFKINSKKPLKTFTTTYDWKSVNNLKKNNFYKVRVRSYVIINGNKKYGAWSNYTQFGVEIKSVNLHRSNSSMKISWKKYTGASKYEIYVSTSSKSGFKKVATTKKLSYKLTKFKKKKLNPKKTYYVKVAAVTKSGKKTIKSVHESAWYLMFW